MGQDKRYVIKGVIDNVVVTQQNVPVILELDAEEYKYFQELTKEEQELELKTNGELVIGSMESIFGSEERILQEDMDEFNVEIINVKDELTEMFREQGIDEEEDIDDIIDSFMGVDMLDQYILELIAHNDTEVILKGDIKGHLEVFSEEHLEDKLLNWDEYVPKQLRNPLYNEKDELKEDELDLYLQSLMQGKYPKYNNDDDEQPEQ